MFYKNTSTATKTFYGVTFKPGDTKDVPGYINDKGFVRCTKPESKEPPKNQSQPSSKSASQPTKTNKNEKKEEPVDGTT